MTNRTGFEIHLNVDKVKRATVKARKQALRRAGEHLLTEANKHVPHDEGALERSGTVDTDGRRAAVSYDTPYAVRQHEDTTLHHTGKGQSKWLENAFTREADTVKQIIATALGEGLENG